ncbi:MAG: hypothetical protein WBE01_03440 [Methyloceanibacter sp.]
MSMRVLFPTFLCLLLTVSATTYVQAEDRIWLTAEPSQGLPGCEDFDDLLDVPGVPAGILAAGRFGREVFAAKDCLDKDNVPLACKHWQRSLGILDKVGPPLDETRGDIVKLMEEHDCDTSAEAPAPTTNPAPETSPGAESTPDADATPDAESSPDTEVSPDADPTPETED